MVCLLPATLFFKYIMNLEDMHSRCPLFIERFSLPFLSPPSLVCRPGQHLKVWARIPMMKAFGLSIPDIAKTRGNSRGIN